MTAAISYLHTAAPLDSRCRGALIAAIAAACPERDAEADAALAERFASPASILEADAGAFSALGGLPPSLALVLSLVPDLARVRQRERSFGGRPLATMEQAGDLLRSMFFGEGFESCWLLSLREDGTPLRVDRVASGTVDETPFYGRIAVQTALESGGDAFVLAHNHPGGSEFASGADVRSTERLMHSMHALGLALVDHLIFAGKSVISLRRCALPSRSDWLRFAPLPPGFSLWLS